MFPVMAAEAEFTDWARLDYRFMRRPLASAYFFKQLRMGDAAEKYREQTWYSAPLGPVTLHEFQQLDSATQSHRQELARDHHDEALKLRAIIWRGWEIWTLTKKDAVAQEAMTEEMGIVTPALKHLKMATGLDPSAPVPWYDLAYFAGVVGDRHLQRQALDGGLNALEAPRGEGLGPVWKASETHTRLRLRLLLDKSWFLRDEGYFAGAIQVVQKTIEQMARDDLRTLDEAREAMLLQALLMVDLGRVHEARQLARKLPTWDLHLQKPPFEYVDRQAMTKSNLEVFSSTFAQDWVWIMTFHALGEKEQALNRMPERNYLTEFPPHLNFRYWRDLGRVLEDFGEREDSQLAYGFSILFHPYFPYFPLQGARGISRVVDQTGSGQAYYLGYQKFFVSGSYFGYAANRIVAMEMAEDSTMVKEQGELAVAALSNCIRRGIRPASSLSLRGRAHYQLGQMDRALADLKSADEMFVQESQPSHEVIKLMAVIHFEKEDYQACLDVLERYVHLCPHEGFGWRTSGLALFNLSRFEEALTVMERSTRVDPESMAGWFNLALLKLQLGQVDEARDILHDTRRKFPESEQVARLIQLVEDHPGQKVKMVTAPIELEVVRYQALWFDSTIASSGLDFTSSLSPEEAAAMLPDLWQRYRNDPQADARLTLARTLLRADQARVAQKLLSPLWPGRLSRDEAILLLKIDRELQLVDRALQAAESLSPEVDPYPDEEFWALVAAICMENGEEEVGRRALEVARELNPGQGA